MAKLKKENASPVMPPEYSETYLRFFAFAFLVCLLASLYCGFAIMLAAWIVTTIGLAVIDSSLGDDPPRGGPGCEK